MEPRTDRLDLGDLGLDRGALVLLQQTLEDLAPGSPLDLFGSDPSLAPHLRAWCRARGHGLELPSPEQVLRAGAGPRGSRLVGRLTCGRAQHGRWSGALHGGHRDASLPGAVLDHPPGELGLAPRGAAVEAGLHAFRFPLDRKDVLWADEAAGLYAQALAGQWDPATAVPWDTPLEHDPRLERALVQVLTYLIENETAALVVPARFASQVHPHFREVQQLLAIQAADEARHIEVFTRRAGLRQAELGLQQLGLSTVGGQQSLRTLVEEPDFELASMLLSVMGEGSFVNLLWFLHRHAPDPVTRTIMKLTAQDEARHVAFAVAHLGRHARLDPALLPRLGTAVEQRHDALRTTAGLNEEVFQSLVVLAAGGLEPEQVATGHAAVVDLAREMDAGRQQRLRVLGFEPEQARALSGLHTRNFM